MAQTLTRFLASDFRGQAPTGPILDSSRVHGVRLGQFRLQV